MSYSGTTHVDGSAIDTADFPWLHHAVLFFALAPVIGLAVVAAAVWNHRRRRRRRTTVMHDRLTRPRRREPAAGDPPRDVEHRGAGGLCRLASCSAVSCASPSRTRRSSAGVCSRCTGRPRRTSSPRSSTATWPASTAKVGRRLRIVRYDAGDATVLRVGDVVSRRAQRRRPRQSTSSMHEPVRDAERRSPTARPSTPGRGGSAIASPSGSWCGDHRRP